MRNFSANFKVMLQKQKTEFEQNLSTIQQQKKIPALKRVPVLRNDPEEHTVSLNMITLFYFEH